jgi:hypothetical protein
MPKPLLRPETRNRQLGISCVRAVASLGRATQLSAHQTPIDHSNQTQHRSSHNTRHHNMPDTTPHKTPRHTRHPTISDTTAHKTLKHTRPLRLDHTNTTPHQKPGTSGFPAQMCDSYLATILCTHIVRGQYTSLGYLRLYSFI